MSDKVTIEASSTPMTLAEFKSLRGRAIPRYSRDTDDGVCVHHHDTGIRFWMPTGYIDSEGDAVNQAANALAKDKGKFLQLISATIAAMTGTRNV